MLPLLQPLSEWASPIAEKSINMMVNINMVHISPWACTEGLFAAAGKLLKPGGILITYGPYSIHGEITPESNVNFNASLKVIFFFSLFHYWTYKIAITCALSSYSVFLFSLFHYCIHKLAITCALSSSSGYTRIAENNYHRKCSSASAMPQRSKLVDRRHLLLLFLQFLL